MTEYLHSSISCLSLHIKALAASDVLDGYFSDLGLPPGASREQIAEATRRLSERSLDDDDDGAECFDISNPRFLASAAFEQLMTATWGRA